jgi:hypothetical protein
MTVPLLKIVHQLSALIGFAFRSQQLVAGQQALAKKQILLVIIHHDTSNGTIDKLRKLSDKAKILSTETVQSTGWLRLWGIPSHRVLGVINGELGRNIIQKVRAGV